MTASMCHHTCHDAKTEWAVLADLQARQSDLQSLQDSPTPPDLSIEEEWEQLQQAGIRSLMSAFRHFMIDDDQGALRAPGQ